jgi:hypothetical protein
MRELPDWLIATVWVVLVIVIGLIVARWLGLARDLAIYVSYGCGGVAAIAWIWMQWANQRSWQRSIDLSSQQEGEHGGD